MILTMPKEYQLTAIISDQMVHGPRQIDRGNNDNFWHTVVFSENFEISTSPKSIKPAFEKLKTEFLHKDWDVHVLILTASEFLLPSENLTAEINLIRENFIAVDVLSFVEVENAKLFSLTAPFGHFFAGKF